MRRLWSLFRSLGKLVAAFAVFAFTGWPALSFGWLEPDDPHRAIPKSQKR